ncbi:hypothetical protein CNEO4_150091 [Clostridium neonatale]|uniref:Uncharacterized protein n=1 Tax=Clostridium neonatale TaxID=137838 RepID=A0AA86JRR5_9CLOT|nr:hypothetical protein CNEO_210118 [Clostridium neonatale]CAG9711257.1 hypothetical protein CNEO_45173 [Clostridium neonatale]CAG9712129.1 hypothetical protein CNEO_160050 [Clostridium neonatale]CAI3214286.1 hypothetical protein CNEO2_60063 [Clostridium neonatale]CAI3217908.1 hypothetical protein CNEO2_100055 [Clostridium neonatale]
MHSVFIIPNNKEKCILSKNNKTIEKLFSTIIIENSLTK